ncbi:MAG: Pyridoxine/pyridoxamine 5'-phosphate oxidase [Holosporales bacterium]
MTHYFKNPPENPFVIFNDWFEKAQEQEIDYARSFALSTVNYLGQPSIRMMMLNELYNQSFVFFTNMESRKALEILDNPNVSLCFYWPKSRQQVRIEGAAFRVGCDVNDKAFAQRPLEHQINILVSPQSRHLENMADLELKTAEMAMELGDDSIERPAYWGGFAVTPSRIEFWEEKPFWMHERLVYTDYQGEWSNNKVYP